jgi:hypothetical protein
MYVLEFSGTNTGVGIDNLNTSTQSGTSTSPGTTTATSPHSANAVAIGAIQSPATVTYSAGPAFTSGTTNNLTKVESTGGGSTEDLIAGYDLPGSTSGQNYAGTYGASNQWSAALLWAEPAGNLDNTSPTGNQRSYTLNNGSQEAWETGFTVGSQTVAAGTYTFTYWTGSCSGTCTVTATLTFGYSSSSECASITTLASWSASIVKGSSGATTNTTTSSSAAIPANSYICWSIAVTATSGGGYVLEYDTSTITTNINTPTISVPEAGLALLGLALMAPIAARRRKNNAGGEVTPR